MIAAASAEVVALAANPERQEDKKGGGHELGARCYGGGSWELVPVTNRFQHDKIPSWTRLPTSNNK